MSIAFRNAQSAQVSQGSGTALSLSINAPTGVALNDVMLAIVAVTWTASFSSITAPSGWTILGTVQNDGATLITAAYWKLATGSEPAAYAWTANYSASSASDFGGAVAAWSGVDSGSNNGMDGTSNPAADGTSGTAVTCSGVSPVRSTDMLICLCSDRTTVAQETHTAPAGMTLRADQAIHSASASWRAVAIAEQQLSSSGATGTRAFTSSQAITVSHVATVALQDFLSAGGAPLMMLLGVG